MPPAVRYPLPNKLIDVIGAESNVRVMRPAFVDPSKDVVITNITTVWVDVNHGAVHLEESNHLFDVWINDERVSFTRGFVNVPALGSDPIMLQIAPLALQNKAVNWKRMPMA